MKKWGIILGVFLCLILFLTVHCKSPATSEAALPVMGSDSESRSNSNAGSTTTNLGSLVIKLKDKPVEDAEHSFVTISSIVVHKADPDAFIVVADTEQEFDLLELKNNPTAIVKTDMDAGHYNQIRMDVVSGTIVFLEDDGQSGFVELPYDLKIPSNEIKIPVQFTIEANGEAEITLDFDAEKSIKVTKQGKKNSYKLRPVIKVVGVSYE